MKVALRGSYMEFVVFQGITEKYPLWFHKEIDRNIYMDESRYTFWIPMEERKPDYYEKQLIEEYSVFLRKPNGDIHVTDYDAFDSLYFMYEFSTLTNSGLAALKADSIEYVECEPGRIPDYYPYPTWFYEYFTEAFNYPQDNETIFIYDEQERTLTASRDCIKIPAGGSATVTEHCVFLRNRFGEIRAMRYDEFLKYYDPSPNERMGK